MNSDTPNPEINDERTKETARHALLRHRHFTWQWGLFVAIALVILGALVAPHLTLLICLALGFFGIAGLLTGWGSRLIRKWFDGR
jgi:hypothetical protein